MADKTGVALGIAGLGLLLTWSGIRNVGVFASARDIIAGSKPTAGPRQSLGFGLSQVSSTPGSASSSALLIGGSANGNAIASDALRYVGTPYVWGGSTPAGWDCSGFVTWVLHQDLGYQLPSNTHTVTMQFYTWSGAQTIDKSEAQAGDLVCWLTHIAIAISPTDCIGAETTGVGTVTGPMTSMGPGGEGYIIRRVLAQSGVSSSVPVGV